MNEKTKKVVFIKNCLGLQMFPSARITNFEEKENSIVNSQKQWNIG